MDASEILKQADELNVRFLRLQFTDINGAIKNVEVPRSQFEKALDGQILFDGSSIEGFVRIEESDMVLAPDLETWAVLPWSHGEPAELSRTARLICDVYRPDGTPLPGCDATKTNSGTIQQNCNINVTGPYLILVTDDNGLDVGDYDVNLNIL